VDQGQLLHDEAAMVGVLVLGQAPLAVDDELDGQGAAHRVLGRGGDSLVEGVGVQALAVVVDGAQGLQGGAGGVELDLLAVEAPARGLHVVLEHLGAVAAAVDFPHGCAGSRFPWPRARRRAGSTGRTPRARPPPPGQRLPATFLRRRRWDGVLWCRVFGKAWGQVVILHFGGGAWFRAFALASKCRMTT